MASSAVPRAAAGLRRVDLRVILGLVILLIGVLGTISVIRGASVKTPVLVMARTVQAGVVITEKDVRTSEVGLAPGLATLPVSQRDLVVGRVASAPLVAGQVLTPAAVTSVPPLQRGEEAMSLAVPPARAAGGVLQPGHWVRVLAVPQKGKVTPLFDAVRVLAIGHGDDAGQQGQLTVTLALKAPQTVDLAQAVAAGSVDLVLLPTSRPAEILVGKNPDGAVTRPQQPPPDARQQGKSPAGEQRGGTSP